MEERKTWRSHLKGAMRLITLLFLALAPQPGFAGDLARGKGGKQRHKVPK